MTLEESDAGTGVADGWERPDQIMLFAGLSVGFALVLCTMLSVPIFAIDWVTWTCASVVVAFLDIALGVVVVAPFIGLRSNAKKWAHRSLALGTTFGLLGVNVFLVWKLLDTHTSLPLVYIGVAPVLTLGAGITTSLRVRHGARWPDSFTLLAIPGGITLGALLALALLLGSAYYHTHFNGAAGPQPPLVSNIKGSYVALGDSYSAGEGLTPWAPNEIDGKVSLFADLCHRSKAMGYPELLKGPKGMPLLARVGSSDASCSGAIVQDVYTPRPLSDTALPQVSSAVASKVGLVTFTMGGNNILFADVVQFCMTHRDCTDATFSDPKNDPARKEELVAPAPLSSWAMKREMLVAADEGHLFSRLRSSFPNARIVAIGYPYLFPAGGPRLPLDCFSELRLVGSEPIKVIRGLQDDFTELIYEEAAQNRIEFVSPVSLWNGHEPCGREGEFTNSLKPYLNRKVINGGSFHPNPAGQRALATVVACYLNKYQSPRSPLLPGESRTALYVAWPSQTGKLASPLQLGLRPIPGWRVPLHVSGERACSSS